MPEGVEAPEKYSWGDIYGIGLILILLPPMLPVWLALYVLLALPLVCINFYGGAYSILHWRLLFRSFLVHEIFNIVIKTPEGHSICMFPRVFCL